MYSQVKKSMMKTAMAVVVIVAAILVPMIDGEHDAYADTYKYKVKVKSSSLNVRSKATTASSKLGSLKKGKCVYPTKIVKDIAGHQWYKIKFKKKTAYIYLKHTTRYYTNVTYTKTQKGTIKSGPLNIRKGAGTSYKKLGTLAKGKGITIKGHYITKGNVKWYRFTYNGKTAYVMAKYVNLAQTASATTVNMTDFEAYMTAQGFPDSYKPYLRTLHKAHPKWIFVAQKTGYAWSTLNTKEQKVGNNLIDSTVSTKWRSTKSSVYDSKTKKWTTFDGGRWYQATDAVIAYYLDPRNFLNDTSIYQFLGHGYDASSQNTDTIRSLVTKSTCFLNTTTYINNLNTAGKQSAVNPNVIAAMIIMEQGWKGTSGLISGTYPGYKGYYNYFNIGAYTTSSMNAVQRGLWWAKGAGTGATSYNRPWNTRQKALTGGAMYFGTNYTKAGQNTYYTKKFNVMNGAAKIATHEYMTNVQGADSEGRLLAYAYRNNSNYPLKFYIPVYSGMPAKAAAKPAT